MPFTSVPYEPIAPSEVVPLDANTFLNERGWYSNNMDPRNGEPLFMHPQRAGYYRWYEAVAMEFIGLVRLGLDRRE